MRTVENVPTEFHGSIKIFETHWQSDLNSCIPEDLSRVVASRSSCFVTVCFCSVTFT